MEYLVLLIIGIIIYALWQSPKNKKSVSNSTSGSYIFRNGKMIKADSVFDAWTSGDFNMMLRALDKPTNLIDRHHLLMNIVDLSYKKRSDPKMAKICAEIAEMHISEFPNIREALIEEFPDFFPRIPTFQQYATLLTEIGEYEKAIQICKKAIDFDLNDGTSSGFIGRIERIRKKWKTNNIDRDITNDETKVDSSIATYDDSIIDITEELSNISQVVSLKMFPGGVPYWEHYYVYSLNEINNATQEQKRFYTIFKNSFLIGEHLDLEGNLNYAFILLFDLLHEYDNHQDISKLEKQLKILGQYYPKTKSYATDFLIKTMFLKGDGEGIKRIREEGVQNDPWRLGNLYKTKLNLNDEEIRLLNRLWYQKNNFSKIEFCFIEIIKFFIATINALNERYVQEGTTIDEQFAAVANVIATIPNRYQLYDTSDNNIKAIANNFYLNIFNRCENAVREYFGHKLKINDFFPYTDKKAIKEFDNKIKSKVNDILSALITKVNLPDEVTDVQLNSQIPFRWKIKFKELTANYDNNPKEFLNSIISLGIVNKRNPLIENIFFAGSKFIANHDKETALILYIHYLYHDLKSATFDNRQFTKTIQKNLFNTNEQLHDFEKIVSELIKNRNLVKALKAVSGIYVVKRKKILLDLEKISNVEQKHVQTVELLNEYLNDEYDDETSSIKSKEINGKEIKIDISIKTDNIHKTKYIEEIDSLQLHSKALDLFEKCNFVISQADLETYAKSNSVLMNQLVDNINEICYEYLDDNLIEEEDEYYSIIPDYFQKILAND